MASGCKGAPPELSVKSAPPAPLCETAKSGFDFRVQECHIMHDDGQRDTSQVGVPKGR